MIEEGISDSSGIEVGAIILPELACILANGMDASLQLPVSDTSGIMIDGISPTIDIGMKTADGQTYVDDTWSNQEVTVTASVYDDSGISSFVYSLDGGVTWSPYDSPIKLKEDGSYSLVLKAMDIAGNETTVQRTVKVSSSGLKLTPTLELADGSPYTSGDWTNLSVTASVNAKTGVSGIDQITYTLNGGAPQAYQNGDPITISAEGEHMLVFAVTDKAGNTLDSSIAIHIDKSEPTVTFGTNGTERGSASARTAVNVFDDASGLDPTSLRYSW
ncbi:hypothetical protein M3202_21375 [Alkalihalobacillus oceani]|uniref:Bacterial Ig-like domain-containing protein n=1 Tax=Halalkalibacter oceani TaxID=1653776 RepID=A0A9X2IQ13_9BACI|nr:Ig-like domain repeat protein [Halalkalibacter oceani]MCM3716599.1 hypothetical protein [Halalkalibacter oceani]